MYAVVQEGEAGRSCLKKKEKAWVGWRSRDDEAKKKFIEEMSKEIEDAAKEIAHKTKKERRPRRQMCSEKAGASKIGVESHGRVLGEMQLVAKIFLKKKSL